MIKSITLTLQQMSFIWDFLVRIIGPLIGALVGVYLGFKINDNRRKELNEEKRLFYKNWLMRDAKKSIELLPGKVNLIPEDAWKSLINSGDIALFKNKAIELGNIFFEVQNYNYEAKLIREAYEREIQFGPFSDYNGKEFSRASDLKDIFNSKTKPVLLQHLRELEQWISPMKAEISSSVKVQAKLKVIDRDGKEK